MGYTGSAMAAAFADMQQNALRAMTGEGLDGRLGIKPRLTPQQAFVRKGLAEKNPMLLRWLGFSEQGAKAAIEAYNPSFTGPQHSNPTGGMTTRNQETTPPRRRQGVADETTMLTGQDAMGGGTMLGG